MSDSASNGGIGFMGMLTLLFVGLKLTGIIEWSWLWVLSPIWLTIVLTIGIVMLTVAFMHRATKKK